jgi:WD40 repeat protein
VTSVACSCDSSLIASGSEDGIVKVYDEQSGDVLHSITTNHWISSVQFSVHGDKLLYTYWNTAKIFDLSRNMQVSTINFDGYQSTFSPDRTRITSGSGRFVKIWTKNGYSNSETVGHHISKVKAITFAPDRRVMGSQSSYDVKICVRFCCPGQYKKPRIRIQGDSEE